MRRLAALACLTLMCSTHAAAQSAGYEPRTMKTLDAQCVARAIDDCVANEFGGPPPLQGQIQPTIDYRGDLSCVQGAIVDADGQLIAACDYNATLHRNTDRLNVCQARVRADPPPQCQSEVLTARGVEEVVREALRAQTAALREALFSQCRASARRPEDCESLRPEGP